MAVPSGFGSGTSLSTQIARQVQRMGRRSEYIPEKKTNRLKYFYAEIPKAMPRIGRRADVTFEESEGPKSRRGHHLLTLLKPISKFDRGEKKQPTLRDLLLLKAFFDTFLSRKNFPKDDEVFGDSNKNIHGS
ncbi:hypothetical protein Anas_09040 [Armadillidium nasatum]|uniref:Uncharacterized protein n=1 Tax=Armadillidium nasatum TaxID=96803 RepID=A0A5N5SUE8_9CRUS|nr:hypothetical protein Anas_09040 [Armadillidium nasatum]